VNEASIERLTQAAEAVSGLAVKDGVFFFALVVMVLVPVGIFYALRLGVLEVGGKRLSAGIFQEVRTAFRAYLAAGLVLLAVASFYWIWKDKLAVEALVSEARLAITENQDLKEQLRGRSFVLRAELLDVADYDFFAPVYQDYRVFVESQVNGAPYLSFTILMERMPQAPPRVPIRYICNRTVESADCGEVTSRIVYILLPEPLRGTGVLRLRFDRTHWQLVTEPQEG
jgi:hypothetical protein